MKQTAGSLDYSSEITAGSAINLFETLLTLVLSISATSIFLLVINRFNSLNAVITGVILGLLIVRFFKLYIKASFPEFNITLLIILLVALFFRAEPYLWLMGGQDQGLYVNMSATYEQSGSTFIKDDIREKLNSEQKEFYDANNQYNRDVKKVGKYEGIHHPGIYIQKLAKSEYVFQFYPLHPLWMAIFGKLFGPDNRVYALVFFSLLSILAFYLIALELSGGRKLPAYLAALFLAVNPLHAFFSKFPVTEVVALAFSAAGFYFLIKYYKESREQRGNRFYLFLSAGLFGCLFFTRISSFMYLPFFYALLGIVIIFSEKLDIRKDLIVYSLAVFGIFALSILYGGIYSFPYFFDTYKYSFSSLLGNGLKFKLPALLLASMLLLSIIYLARGYFKKIGGRLIPALPKILAGMIVLIIMVGIYKAYQLGFTGTYINDPWIGVRWHMAGLGWPSWNFSSIVVTVLYLSPFGFLAFLLALNKAGRKKDEDVLTPGLLFFLVLAWFYIGVMQFVIPYQYYYARYLLSELAPYSFLLISLYLGSLLAENRAKQIAAGLLVIAIVGYSLYFSGFQLAGREADGAAASLKKIESRLDDKDLLLVTFNNYQLITPLKYYFHLNVFAVNLNVFAVNDLPEAGGKLFSSLIDNYNEFYVLSNSPLTYDYLRQVDVIGYKQGIFEHAAHIPTRFGYQRTVLYLYQIKRESYFDFTGFLKPGWGIIENFYDDKIWTNGAGIIKNLHYRIKAGDSFLALNTAGWHPYKDNPDKLRLKLLINGKPLLFSHMKNNSYYFKLDQGIREINEIRILSTVFIPKDLGINEDTRQLGIDVVSLKIE